MANATSSSNLAPKLAVITAGVVSAFAAMTANGHGGGGGGHGGGAGAGARGGVMMGRGPVATGRMPGGFYGGSRWNGGAAGYRGGYRYGWRGPGIIVGSPFYYYGYGPYFVPPPVPYYAPPPVTYVVESAPPPPPPPPQVIFVQPPPPPAPPANTSPPPKPPEVNKGPQKNAETAACSEDVYQIRAFSPSSSMEKQFPEKIDDKCRAAVRQINVYNDKPATGIDLSADKVKGLSQANVTVTYSGVAATQTSASLLAVECPKTVFNVRAMTPSSAAWDKLFTKVPEKCNTSTFNIPSTADQPADSIKVTLQQRKHGGWDDTLAVQHAHQVPLVSAAAAQPAATSVNGTTANSPQTASAKAPSSHGHGWLWAIGGLGVLGVLAYRAHKNRGEPDPTPPGGGGEPAAHPEAAATATRQAGKDPFVTPLSGASAQARAAFTGGEVNQILKAWRENRETVESRVDFRVKEGNNPKVTVETADSRAEVGRERIAVTKKSGAQEISDATIKGALESAFSLYAKDGKCEINLKTADAELEKRIRFIAAKAEGNPFVIVNVAAAAAEMAPIRRSAAEEVAHTRWSVPGNNATTSPFKLKIA